MQWVHHKIAYSIRQVLTVLLNLIYPPVCPLCGRPLSRDDHQLCPSCLAGFQLIGKAHEKFSVPGEIFITQAWALFEFDQAFQQLIHQLKYARRRKPVLVVLHYYRSQILAQLSDNRYDLIISIPLHPRKFRERGYNQVAGVSRWLAENLGAVVGNDIVERRVYTQTQTQLNARERQRNVARAFAVKKGADILGKRLLLVDDVLTTGATANAVAQVLKAAGAGTVDLLTLSTPKAPDG